MDGEVITFGVDQKQEREDKGEESGVKYHRIERTSQFQRRAMRMPENACLEEGKMKASYENGTLKVCCPKKSTSKEQGKRIEIA